MHIANKFIKASSIGIVETLNNLIMHEFLIRDILENYSYLFEASVAIDTAKYKPRDSLLFLQKQIIFLGGKPTTQRLAIPAINPCSYDSVIELIKESTRKLIESYLLAIASIENEQKYLTLKVMLQKIVQTKTCLCEVQVG
jgi:bacterioferritin (cytochrome b1)